MIWLRRWLAVCCLTLLAATWRLWTPQTVFPQIPFLAVLRTAPPWLDWLGLATLVSALFAMLILPSSPRRRPASAGRAEKIPAAPYAPSPEGEGRRTRHSQRIIATLFVAGLTLLVLLDQHRFQPWAYQFGLVAIVLAFAPAARAASLLRMLTIGIYFWSAVSKLDYTFLHGLGPELLRGLLSALQLEPRWIRPEVATALAWAFPLDELAVAVLLSVRKMRTIGLMAAIVMHVALLATLGPFGLNHAPGVLLWNVYFIGQNILLFRRPADGWFSAVRPQGLTRFRDIYARPATNGIAYTAVFAGICLPALEPLGLLDHWPGWAVYTPSAARVSVVLKHWFHGVRTNEGTAYYSPPTNLSFPGTARPDLWSLDTLSVPLYPDERFSAGVAISIIDRYKQNRVLKVTSRADRFTGERSETLIFGEQVNEYTDSFWLNARSRKIGDW